MVPGHVLLRRHLVEGCCCSVPWCGIRWEGGMLARAGAMTVVVSQGAIALS